MNDRAQRREEIKLLLEYVKVGLSLAGVAAVLVAICQWQLANQIATETVYQRMTNEWRDHLKSFVDKPLLRPYFEEGKPLVSNDPEHAQAVLALADIRLDVADAILSYAAFRKKSDEIGGWKNTFSRAFQTSPVLCARFNETKNNYVLVVPIAVDACGR
jgi:hypothetical protein